MNLLGTRLVPRLLLSFFIAHDTLVGTVRRLGLGPWHAFLAAVFAALILRTFQIVLSGHCDQILFLQPSGSNFRRGFSRPLTRAGAAGFHDGTRTAPGTSKK